MIIRDLPKPVDEHTKALFVTKEEVDIIYSILGHSDSTGVHVRWENAVHTPVCVMYIELRNANNVVKDARIEYDD